MNRNLERALQYAGRGWRVVPLYPLRNGVCTCRKGLACGKSAGKHPDIKTGKWHLKGASSDAAQMWAWFEHAPNRGVGIVTGQASGLCVIDIDGAEGQATLESLLSEHGPLPTTAYAKSGRQGFGLHLYFSINGSVPTNSGQGLDIRGDGGLCVADPTKHYSGDDYAWLSEAALAPLPDWLLAWFSARERVTPAALLSGVPTYAKGSSLAARGLANWYASQVTAPIGDIVAALALIPNEPKGWDWWDNVVLATYAASEGSLEGEAAIHCYSAKCVKYDKEYTSVRWQEIARSPPSRTGFGALVKRVHAFEPDWEPPSRARRTAVPAQEVANANIFGEVPEKTETNGHHSVEQMLGPAFAQTTPTNPLIELNKKYSVIRDVGGKCLILSFVNSKVDQSVQVPCFQTCRSFSEYYANRYVMVQSEDKKGNATEEAKQLGAQWLKWTKRSSFEGIDLLPGAPKVLPSGYLNLWRGFAVEPAPGSWKCLQEHVGAILGAGDAAAASYILRYAAWAVQHPDEPAEVALVFRGGKGSGKGTFANALKRLFGQHGLQIFNSKHLVGAFNGHLRNCILLFADEAFWAGDKQGESVLKGMLTEPALMIEQKGVDAAPWKNRLHVIMAANAEWVVPASHDERRYAMFDVSDARIGDRAYFAALHREIANGGLAAMLHDMQRVELGDWHPRQIVHNAALRGQKVKSLDPRWEWWEGLLQLGVLPHWQKTPDLVASSAINQHVKDASRKLADVSTTAMGRFLRDVGCTGYHKSQGNFWRFPPLGEARQAWENRFGAWEWVTEHREWQVRGLDNHSLQAS